MGEDPNRLTYIVGTACPVANPTFGVDGTPKYILVTLTGLSSCPAGSGAMPPGAMRLTQRAFPLQCQWEGTSGPWSMEVTANVGDFTITLVTSGPPIAVGFGGIGPATQIDNTLVCVPTSPGILTTGGSAIISWGPNI